ncbi:MAG: methyltransferase [Paracoccaceae bacterium]
MRALRLTHALDMGVIALPETGSILAVGPSMNDNFNFASRDRIVILTGFKPYYDFFTQCGYQVTTKPTDGHAAALVCMPRSKDDALALIALAQDAVVPGGLVMVDGQKTDGIASLHRDMRNRGMASEALSKAHGKIFSFIAGHDVSEWQTKMRKTDEGFITQAGLFSPDAPDRGSVLLANALPNKLGGHVVDLGAGWGYLSYQILKRETVKHLDLVEAEANALDCARQNVCDERANFHWLDARKFKPVRVADAVLCNPPFHTSRQANSALGIEFITAAATILSPGGTLWLVANRHLPYGKHIAALFSDVEELGGDATYRVIRAARPLRQTPNQTGA